MSEESQDLTTESEAERDESIPLPEGESVTESQAENKFVCEACGASFKSRFALLGHKKRHKSEEKHSLSNKDAEISALRTQLLQVETGRKLAEEEVKKLKASRELESLRTPASSDPVEAHITRLLRLKEVELLGASAVNARAPREDNSEIAALREEIRTLKSQHDSKAMEERLRAEFESKYAKPPEDMVEMDIPSGGVDEQGHPVMQHVRGIPTSMLPLVISQGRQALTRQKENSMLTEAVTQLGQIIMRTQGNIATLGHALLESPRQPPAPVPGSMKNPEEEILQRAGLIDYVPKKEKST